MPPRRSHYKGRHSLQQGQNNRRLAHLPDGKKGKVIGIQAGRRAIQRLSGLGITPGTVVEVKGRGPFGGPVRIGVRGTQLAIGRALAHKIVITPM